MDSLCVRSGLHGLGSTITLNNGLDGFRPSPSISSVGRSPTAATNAISVDKTASSSSSSSKFNYPFRSLFFGGERKQRSKGVALDDAVLMEEEDVSSSSSASGGVAGPSDLEGQNGNWVLKILHVRSLWSSPEKQGKGDVEERENEGEGQNGNFTSCSNSDEGCKACYSDEDDNDDDEKNVEFDRNSFSKMLKKVSLSEAKLYAQMSYLGSLAYCIPSIKPRNLLKRYSLRYVTSSIEKRELLAEAEKKEELANSEAKQKSDEAESKNNCQEEAEKSDDQKKEESRVREMAAFQVAASAASFLHSRTRTLLSSRSKDKADGHPLNKHSGNDENLDINSDMASLMATTDSVTAVVAAKEEVKQAVADDLNSISSAPCEWYICDDDMSATRFFVIQGSETLASWQANLLFEPVNFEGLDVLVHRGIYEAAKGMYQQMLPEVQSYMKTHGSRAKFRFTGHSLGGSLSLLINLMLLMRGEVPYTLLLPVITFGSPGVMCGGDKLLRKLGLPKNHIQAIVMHRDIVPRAFSCNYPRAAAQLLKAVNGSFRNHPCLNNQKLLYAPMGDMLVLQPDEKFSPQHDLLPSGSGLYLLTYKIGDAIEGEKKVRAAKNVFLNTPHPLEILSDRSAYGNDGTIQRDHDMNSYLKCVRGVIRLELSRIRKAKRERRRQVWWPLVTPHVADRSITVGTTLGPINVGQAKFKFAGMVKSGRESLKRFSRLVASQHMHLLVVLLFPARMLLIGAYSVINYS